MTWLKSPYILWLLVAVGVVVMVFYKTDTHFVDSTKEQTFITFNDETSFQRPGEEAPTVYPVGTTFTLLAKSGNGRIIEDSEGNRMKISRPAKDTYTLSGSQLGVNRHIESSFKLYIKPDDAGSIASGRNISDFISEYGDYTEANPGKGYYEFLYLVPIIDGVRYESGIILHTDGEGVIISSDIKDPSYTSTNFFTALPFFDTIVSWNLVNRLSTMYEDSEPADGSESEGFVSTILGWIWGLVWGIAKFFILLVILFLLFVLPTMAICSVTGPMIHFKSISDNVINGINIVFALPVLYIIFISMTDFFHSLWLIMIPIFVVFCFMSLTMTMTQTTARRCSSCRSVDTIVSKTVQVGTPRVTSHYETVKHESDKLKHEGYSLRRGREEWSQKVTYSTYLVTTTETDWRTDWHCTACGASGSRTYTTTDKRREFVDSRNDKEIWIEK